MNIHSWYNPQHYAIDPEQRRAAASPEAQARRQKLYAESVKIQLDWLRSLTVAQISPELVRRFTVALTDSFFLNSPITTTTWTLATDEQKDTCRQLLLEVLEQSSSVDTAGVAIFAEYYGLNMATELPTQKKVGLRYDLTANTVSQHIKRLQQRLRRHYIASASFRQRLESIAQWEVKQQRVLHESSYTRLVRLTLEELRARTSK